MKKIYYTIFICALFLICYLAYEKFCYLNITIKFDDLEPFEKQIPVYYKGFKIGKTVKIYPDKDYIVSYMDIKISPPDVKFPSNITARLESGISGDYINILPPCEATVKVIKDGDIITGETGKNLQSILTDSLTSGNISEIIGSASNVMNTADLTMKELTKLFAQLNSVIEDVRCDLKKTSSNMAETSKNISILSGNINNALDKESLDFSVENIKETTENIKEISENIEQASEQINNITVPRINNVLCQTEKATANTAELTEDIKKSVKERNGITGFLFGKKN